MSDYSQQDNYWGQSPQQTSYNFEGQGFGQPDQQFEFQSYSNQPGNESYGYPPKTTFLDPTQSAYGGNLYGADDFGQETATFGEEDEPPLLEELGIDPDRIIQKTLAVMNPFHKRGQTDDASYLTQDSDLAGPVAFCLMLAGCLLLAGSKAHFGYVYGLAVTSCVLMYILQSLMSSTGNVTLSSVASVLGYCILPVVGLAGLSVFTTLQGTVGFALATLAVSWAALSASRLFCAMSGEDKQRLLIAYPCVVLYGVFTLIVIFQN